MKNYWDSQTSAQKAIHGTLIFFSMGLWLPVLYFKMKSDLNTKNFVTGKIQLQLDGAMNALESFEKMENQFLKALEGKTKLSGTTLISLSGIAFLESREGASRTTTQGTYEATTKTGTIGVALTQNISVAASKGQTKGTLTQNSVTYRGADQLTQVDNGKLTLSGDGISFVGGLFTRTTDFASLLDAEMRGNFLTIASSNYEKTWVLNNENQTQLEVMAIVLDVLRTHSEEKMTVASFRKKCIETLSQSKAELNSKCESLRSELATKAID